MSKLPGGFRALARPDGMLTVQWYWCIAGAAARADAGSQIWQLLTIEAWDRNVRFTDIAA